MNCPHCGKHIPMRLIASEAASRAAKKNPNAGRKKKLEPCPRCGVELGARERRSHRCEEPEK